MQAYVYSYSESLSNWNYQSYHSNQSAVKPTTATEKLDPIVPEALGEKINAPLPSYPSRLALSTLEGIHMVSIEDIVRLKADNNYTTVYFDDGRSLMVSKTLKEVEQKLNPARFIRIHQSHTVDLSKIKIYQRGRGGNVTMTTGDLIPVSKVKKSILLKAMQVI